MNENIKESRRDLVWSVSVVLAGLAGIWWGVRTGSAVIWISRSDPRPALCSAMILALLIQGFSNLKKDRRYTPLYRILVWYSGIMIPILIYGLGATFMGDIVIFLIHLFRRNSALSYNLSALIALPFSLAVTIYGLIHARCPIVQKYAVFLPDHSHRQMTGTEGAPSEQFALAGSDGDSFIPSPAAQRDPSCRTRIVQLSDLHMGTVVTPAYVHRILRKTAELHPDYVVLTGDIVNHGYVEETSSPDKIEKWFSELNRSLDASSAEKSDRLHSDDSHNDPASDTPHTENKSLTPPSRIYAVLGNHDPQPDDPALQEFLKNSNITLLCNRTVSLPEFYLAGRRGNHIDHRPELSTWLSSVHEGKPLILLDHYPDSIHEAERLGVDLLLSGHTHGGQYFPCNLLIRKHYAHGLMHGWSLWGNTQSIVSWGAGFFQIPIRIGTSSEIVCVDLARAE